MVGDIRESIGRKAGASILTSEGRESILGPLWYKLYGVAGKGVRAVIRRFVLRLEGGELYSRTIRRIFRDYHGVDVGLYTAGAPFIVHALPQGTCVGRFSSVFWTVRGFVANHPMNLRSTHALFYNPALRLVETDVISRGTLAIGNDVWIGHNAIILPSVRTIGDGAVIGAGSVVHDNVPPYAVVVGHPARVVRFRFSRERIAALLEERWWEQPLAQLAKRLTEFREPLEGDEVR